MSITELSRSEERRRSIQHHVVDEPSIALVRDDLYAVLSPTQTMGFVERVGNVYVALEGADLARACEVGQSLSWDIAVSMVSSAHRAHA